MIVLYEASNVCTLDVVVPDDEFVAMVEVANRFRSEVWTLGMTGTDINANVSARLYWNSKVLEPRPDARPFPNGFSARDPRGGRSGSGRKT